MSTANKNLNIPANNSYTNTWDVPVNTNFTGIDYALGGVTSINVTGASTSPVLMDGSYSSTYPYPPNNITVSGNGATPSYIPYNITIYGTLTTNLVYRIPSGVSGQWSVYNNTTTTSGNTISFQVGTGAPLLIESGKRRLIVSDGTNLMLANSASDAQGTPNSLQFNSGSTFAGSSLTYNPSTGAYSLDPLVFVGTATISQLTTTYAQPLVSGMILKTSTGTVLGTVASNIDSKTWNYSGTATAPGATFYAYPASAGIALTINSYDGQYGQQIVAGTIADNSFGLRIKAGTSSNDFPIYISTNDSTPIDYFKMDGNGSTIIGNQKAASTLPTLTVQGNTSSTQQTLKVVGGAATPTYDVSISGSTATVDCSKSNMFNLSLTTSITLLISNPYNGQSINIFLHQGAGNSSVTWPSNFLWQYGSAPTLSTTAGWTDIISAIYRSSNASWYATINTGYQS